MSLQEDNQYKQQGDEPTADKPICVRIPQSVDDYLRSLEDRSVFIREAVAKAIKEDQ